jgi:CheY-like chemotaxis protein
MLFSPTIGAAIAAQYWFLWIQCPACRTINAIDLRPLDRHPALRSIPIIAVTSYALSGEGQKARVAGCDDYVPKPFSPRQLLAKIRQHLS